MSNVPDYETTEKLLDIEDRMDKLNIQGSINETKGTPAYREQMKALHEEYKAVKYGGTK